MSVLASDFSGSTVLIYDSSGNHLNTTTIKTHEKKEQFITVRRIPGELTVNDSCKLVILSSPTPCEFSGKIQKSGGSLFIAMYQGQKKENRNATRYPVKASALIDALIIDDYAHALQTPIKVDLVNISTSGMRFRAPYYSLLAGDIIKMHLIISKKNKMITAEVNNSVDHLTEATDYGCHFLEIEQ